MNTRWLMDSSTLFLAILGLAATFAPQEILAHYAAPENGLPVLIVQIVGALYLGFAMLNFMSRGAVIGGIYSRPVTMSNFLHFAAVAMVLLKALWAGPTSPEIIGITACYVLFAAWFGRVLFTRPAQAARE